MEKHTTNLDPLIEFRLLAAEKHIEEQEKLIRELETKIQSVKEYYETQERSRLKWGISSLGTLVMLLGGVLWNYRGVIFKGSN